MEELEELLNEKYLLFNSPNFIDNDPIVIPHRFSIKEDIEIAGFITSILAWGQRKTIINKCTELLQLMDNAPHDFIVNHTESDLRFFACFKHRTFNTIDTHYFITALKHIYLELGGLEKVLAEGLKKNDCNIENGLIKFRESFFSLNDYPTRTTKHIASPARNSACKRLNMFLRWMVRKDQQGVDFGIWNKIKPSQLICPLDVHVERVGRKLGLISLPKPNWKMALELTEQLKRFDPEDPVKYDFALFGLGVEGYL